MAAGPPRTAQQENRRALWSWALYDWANSAFFTIILTFIFARYFSQSVVQDDIAGTNAWGNIVGVSGIVVALLAPVLGAIADQSGRRKPWLIAFTLLCVVGSGMLWFVEPGSGDLWFSAFWVSVGILGLSVPSSSITPCSRIFHRPAGLVAGQAGPGAGLCRRRYLSRGGPVRVY